MIRRLHFLLVMVLVVSLVTLFQGMMYASAVPAYPAHAYSASDTAVRFAVIGDYGRDNEAEARVAALVKSWNPDFIITTGDNNYPDGEAATIDDNIGKYFSDYIGNYQGAYGPGSSTNRFWPSLGNHDWHSLNMVCIGSNCTGPYFDYFTLPHNERYYAADLGLVQLFALDGESEEPDGRDQDSIQAAWLRNELAASTACYNMVYFHHPPYSSGRHGSSSTMQWPFAAWGTQAVFGGHDHLYERLEVDGIPYFVNGAGGAGLYTFDNSGSLEPEATSVVRYNQDHGAMLVTASATNITYQFYNADGLLIDNYTVDGNCAGSVPTATVTAVSTATVSVTPTPIPTPISTPTPSGIGVLEVRVDSGSDDAEERADGSMYLTSSDLEFVYDTSIQTVGMRFNNITIPQGVTITNAYIQFQVDETHTTSTTLTLQAEAVDQAVTFENMDGNISSRPRTMASVSWSPPVWTTTGEAGPDQQTPDISSLIQELVNRDGWANGNSVVIIVTGTGERAARAYDGDPAAAPLLHIEYATSPPPTPIPTPGEAGALEVRVDSGSDDAEEREDGGMYLTSSDLELVYDGGVQTVGMRFNNIIIPQGVTITNAYIQFQVDETHTISTTLTLQAEAVDHAVTFENIDGNISSRPRTTTSVTWSPPDWITRGEAGPDQQTPNISSLIQELVNRDGWAYGNSLVIIVTGTGERSARSFDGDPAAAPLLHVEYITSGGSSVVDRSEPGPVRAQQMQHAIYLPAVSN